MKEICEFTKEFLEDVIKFSEIAFNNDDRDSYDITVSIENKPVRLSVVNDGKTIKILPKEQK